MFSFMFLFLSAVFDFPTVSLRCVYNPSRIPDHQADRHSIITQKYPSCPLVQADSKIVHADKITHCRNDALLFGRSSSLRTTSIMNIPLYTNSPIMFRTASLFTFCFGSKELLYISENSVGSTFLNFIATPFTKKRKDPVSNRGPL